MDSNEKEITNHWGKGSLFRFANLALKDLRRFDSIESRLFRLVLDEQKREEAIPQKWIMVDKKDEEKYPGQLLITRKELETGLPKELESFFLESIQKLNELGETYKPVIDEEKSLCKNLKNFKHFELQMNFDQEKNNIIIIKNSPVEKFIKDNYELIINIRKHFIKNTIKENVYLEDKKQMVTKINAIQNFISVNTLSISNLQEMSNLFKDAALKYPRLIHVVLEWPLLSQMPKLPRELLNYCEPAEYEYMLRRHKIQVVQDSAFSTPETQSTCWIIYPKGESWNKKSGIKLYNELGFDIHALLNCNWEMLLHIFGLTMSYGNNHHILYDGWDGLFDEDCHYSHDGFKNNLYNCYYITDVFYESMRLCKELISIAEKETNKKDKDLQKYLDILHISADRACVEEVKIIYEVIEFCWLWISKDIQNKDDFTKSWAEIFSTTNDRIKKIVTWLKWNKSEVSEELEKQYADFIKFFEQEISDKPICKDISTSILAAKGHATELAENLRHIAELAKATNLEPKLHNGNQNPLQDKQLAIKNKTCWHSEDFLSVIWYGKEYDFNKTQAQCVSLLWNNGRLSEKTIGEKIGSVSDNYRLVHTFRKHPAWDKMIVSDGKGIYKLSEKR